MRGISIQNHNIQADQNRLMLPETFANQSFNPVPAHRCLDKPLTDGQTKAGMIQPIVSCQ
jgi:hypothetical protein